MSILQVLIVCLNNMVAYVNKRSEGSHPVEIGTVFSTLSAVSPLR